MTSFRQALIPNYSEESWTFLLSDSSDDEALLSPSLSDIWGFEEFSRREREVFELDFSDSSSNASSSQDRAFGLEADDSEDDADDENENLGTRIIGEEESSRTRTSFSSASTRSVPSSLSLHRRPVVHSHYAFSDPPTTPEPRTPASTEAASRRGLTDPLTYYNHFSYARHYPFARHIFDLSSDGEGFRNPFTRPETEMYGEWRYGSATSDSSEPEEESDTSASEYSSPSISHSASPTHFPGRSRLAQAQPYSPIGGSPFADPFSSIEDWLAQNSLPSSTTTLTSSRSSSTLFSPPQSPSTEFFSALDVEGLLADPTLTTYNLIDNDNHPDKNPDHDSDLADYVHHIFLPHDPEPGCRCHWCLAYYEVEGFAGEDEASFHEPSVWCHCMFCSVWRLGKKLEEERKRWGM